MQAKIEKMRSELASAKVVADDAKSTWEKLRKERDYHKAHQNRVNDEKITITANIKKVVQIQGETEEKIVDVKKKLLNVQKEKALCKLEKDKLNKKAFELTSTIKQNEQSVQARIERQHRNQRQQNDTQQMQDSQLL